MPDMPRPRPPHLQRGVSRHSKVYWFVQMKRGAPKIRIRGEYGTPEFEAAYQAAVTNAPARKPPEIKASRHARMGVAALQAVGRVAVWDRQGNPSPAREHHEACSQECRQPAPLEDR
jgi:hypothetical protein